MALVTSILRGGTNSHETTSEEANGVYTDFVSEGIVGSVGNTSGVAPATGGFAVNAQGTPDMTVAVSAGVAYVNATPTSQNNQTFRIKNSASSNVTISANSSGSTKYDWIYLKLDADKLNNPNTAGDDAATLVASRSSSAASDDGTPPTYGYPLAVVTVANGASTITNGTIRDVRSQVALNTGSSNASDGWTSLSSATTLTTATGYNKGNKEYDLTSSADLTSVLSPGMRLKVTRGTTPPTQCADLEASSSQYAGKTSPSGITFTDDFTVEAWIKLESYTAGSIITRFNGSSGWGLRITSSGQVNMFSGAANYDEITSYQAVPIGEWTHVAATLDMSGSTGTVYMNGALVSSFYTNQAVTSLTQAGDLQIGATNATVFFDGKVSDVRVWSAVRTATQIRDNMNQQLVGNETYLVAYFKLDGNLNDSTSNANNLSASGGAAATNSDNPMNATEYAIVTKVTASTVTVFTGASYNIPNLTLSTPYYSTQKAPFGFPAERGKWAVKTIYKVLVSQVIGGYGTKYNIGSMMLSVPTGAWTLSALITIQQSNTSGGSTEFVGGVSDSSSAFSSDGFMTQKITNFSTITELAALFHSQTGRSISTQTPYYYVMQSNSGGGTVTIRVDGSTGEARIEAECAYI